eukprot:m.187679 g.187679  ORF g.187679 m.187679 type:complete len:124 (+) comp10549_c0_seq6:1989-2360(+)
MARKKHLLILLRVKYCDLRCKSGLKLYRVNTGHKVPPLPLAPRQSRCCLQRCFVPSAKACDCQPGCGSMCFHTSNAEILWQSDTFFASLVSFVCVSMFVLDHSVGFLSLSERQIHLGVNLGKI